MSDSETPGSPPPELPEEYRDAYNEAYRRALEADEVVRSAPEAGADAGLGMHAGPAPRHQADAAELIGEVAPQEVVAVGAHRPGPVVEVDEPARPGWLVPALLGLVALLLVLAAYAVGKALSGDDASPSESSAHTQPTRSESPTRKPSHKPSRTPSEDPAAWKGDVSPVAAKTAQATCHAPASVDSAGTKVTYFAPNTLDDDPATAWRCDGSAVGQKIRFTLPSGTEVAEVGMIPGYAKTDPASGTDRYAENNRITRVRWTFPDGSTVVQRLDPDPKKRDLQTVRVPATKAGTVTMEILAVARGPRNTTAISEVSFGAAER